MDQLQDSNARQAKKGKLKLGAALVAACAFAGFVLYLRFFTASAWVRETRQESIQVLLAAKTTSELANSVGNYGVFLTASNSEWAAIRYMDCHAPYFRSLAIVRDSGGRWYESHRHFCGRLPAFKMELNGILEQRASSPDWLADSIASTRSKKQMPADHELLPLYTAPDLAAVRRQLLMLGFEEFTP